MAAQVDVQAWESGLKGLGAQKKAQYLRPSFYSKAQHLEMWKKKKKKAKM